MSTLFLDRISVFATSIVTTVIVFIVALVILRMIAQAANLNFFGWPYVTIRRLTDPFLAPVRVALRGFGVDPKYAPLVAILITILLGYVVVRLKDTILFTIAGMLSAVQQHSPARVIGQLLYGLLAIYILLIFMRIVFSWVMISYQNRIMRFLFRTTEPLLAPLRRMIPPVGPFDISAFVAFLIIWLFQAAIAGTLLR